MWLLCVLWHVCVNEANHLYSGMCPVVVWEADWDVKMIWDFGGDVASVRSVACLRQ
jgi:hypothetical protein